LDKHLHEFEKAEFAKIESHEFKSIDKASQSKSFTVAQYEPIEGTVKKANSIGE